MNVKQWICALALAVTAPVVLAAPATLSVTSTGTVSSGTFLQYPDIAVGSQYELTVTARYEQRDVIVTGPGFRSEWLGDSLASASLKVGDRTYDLGQDRAANLYVEYSYYQGRDNVGLLVSFADVGNGYTYSPYVGISWPVGDFSLDRLLTGTLDQTFGPSFALDTAVIEDVPNGGRDPNSVRMTPSMVHISVAPVPEPQTWAMMLEGVEDAVAH